MASKILNGFFWTSALRGSARLANVARTAVVARILLPSQFGLYGLAILCLGLVEIITETGINVFLLQEEDGPEKYVDTAWIISIFRGVVTCIALLVASVPVAAFFNMPSAAVLVKLISIVPLLRGFINPACVSYQKDLRFDREFAYRMSIVLVEAAASVYFSLVLKSAVGLALGMTVSAAWETILSFVVFTPRPRPRLNLSQFRLIVNRGKWVTLFGLTDYIFNNGDNIAVGRILGSESLGLYQNAYKLSTLPVTEVNDIFYKATFPVFAKSALSRISVKSQALRFFLWSSLLRIGLSLFVFIFAAPLVNLLLGPAWTDTIPLVRTLAFLGAIRGTATSFNSLFMAKKQQHIVSLLSLFATLVMLLTVAPLISTFGLSGAAYSVLIGSLLSLPLSLYFTLRLWRSL